MTDFDRGKACRAAFLMLACVGLAPAQTLPVPAILPDAKLVLGLRVNRALDGISPPPAARIAARQAAGPAFESKRSIGVLSTIAA